MPRISAFMRPALAGLVAGIVLSGSARAAMDEIIVTAERRAEPLAEVPVAVSAFDASQMTNLQIDALKDIGTNVPNLQMYTVTAGSQAVQIHARGASVQNPGFNLSESPVGIYQDDVYFGRLASVNLDLTDMERIEVLRGPQGTLYGRNTIAGAVKLVSRTPGDDFWANASAGVGNYETTKLTAALGGPISEGELAGSIAGLWDHRTQGWQDRYTLQPDNSVIPAGSPGNYENTAVRGKLHWYGEEGLDVVLTGFLVDVSNDGYNGVPYAPFANTSGNVDFDPAPAGSKPLNGFYSNFDPDGVNFGSSNQSGGSLVISYDLDSVTLKSITGGAHIDDKFGFDLAGGGFAGIEGVQGLIIDSNSDFDQWSQELQALGQAFDKRLDWLLGLYYLKEDGHQWFSGTLAAITDLPAFDEYITSTTKSYAAYGQGTWHFTDKWSVTAGLRWTKDDKDYSDTCYLDGNPGSFCADGDFPPGDTTPDTETVGLSDSWSETTGKLAVEYRIDEDQNTYLSFAQGFQAGGFRTLCFGLLTEPCGGSAFGPQKVNSLEAGYKANLLDRTVSLNVAVFDAMYKDIQQIVMQQLDFNGDQVPDLTIFPIDNIGDVDVYGVELEVHWAPTDRIDIFADFGFQDSNFGSVDPTSPPGGLVSSTPDVTCPDRPNPNTAQCAAPARDLPSNPKWQGKIGFNYTIPLDNSLEFFYGADLYHTDSYYSESRNLVKIDAYSRLNGFLGVGESDKRWQAVVSAKNITNRDDNVSGIFSQGFTNVRTPLPPAEYMLTFRYNY